VLNGVPCSGKSTLARAFQADMDEPWLGIDLDTFTPNLPPRRTWSEPKVLRRIVAGGNAAVVAVAEAGNDVVIELVARKDPGASFVLDDLFERLASFDVVLVYLRCSFESAKRREASRPDEMKGLVQRDYGNVEDESFDTMVDTDALSVPEQVRRLRHALTVGPTGGLERLRSHVHRQARQDPSSPYNRRR
jgi:chloramphenicol 3-O phosphotransferase